MYITFVRRCIKCPITLFDVEHIKKSCAKSTSVDSMILLILYLFLVVICLHKILEASLFVLRLPHLLKLLFIVNCLRLYCLLLSLLLIFLLFYLHLFLSSCFIFFIRFFRTHLMLYLICFLDFLVLVVILHVVPDIL